MKTIEEKAKAYDEALERAKQIRNGNPSSGTAIVVCEQIFPELRESEDEKTRKELMNEICCLRASEEKGSDRYESLTRMLIYLQRQKEQKPTSFYEPYNSDDYEVVVEGNATSLKRKEQKQDVHQINMTIHPGPNIPSCPDPVIAEVKELKSNDKYIKRNSKELGSLLTQYYDEGFWKGRKAERESQKPAWSEEDETKLNDVIHLIEKHCGLVESIRKHYVKFLKSLRPSRKLSEDQIYTLERICSNLHLRASDDAPKLDEIIELLKQK